MPHTKTVDINDKVTISNPNDDTIVDNVLLMWKQEPETEDLVVSELAKKINRRQSWSVEENDLVIALENHNLYETKEHPFFTYKTEPAEHSVDVPSKLQLKKGKHGMGLYAKSAIKAGELVFEEEPVCHIPPLDRLQLIKDAHACCYCGEIITKDSHEIMMQGLDCQCNEVFCSVECKKGDKTHASLKHTKRAKTGTWLNFEKFCLEQSWNAAYSVGILYAADLLSETGFSKMCRVSQRVRVQARDSSNIGGAFDASEGYRSIQDYEPLWAKAHELFVKCFPNSLTLDEFLLRVGTFQLNQRAGQIYPLYSYLNHSCEPSVESAVVNKKLTVTAKRDILQGQEITTSYVNTSHEVYFRKRELRVNYGFVCDCARCAGEYHRRKSSVATRPDLGFLKGMKEFDLEPQESPFARRKSVRFDEKVTAVTT